jgi:hypothetical protein
MANFFVQISNAIFTSTSTPNYLAFLLLEAIDYAHDEMILIAFQ